VFAIGLLYDFHFAYYSSGYFIFLEICRS